MTTQQDELATRVSSYVRHQVAKGPEAIRDTIQKGHDQLLGTIDGLSKGQAAFKPGPDDWSVLEVLRHVLAAKRGTARLCAALARGEDRAGEARMGDGADSGGLPSLVEARAAVDAAHEELLAFVASLSSDTNLEARFAHPFFGALNCQEWAVFQRVHDADHAQQIEQIRASPGFAEA